MTAPARPRGIFDDVPTIGGGEEPGAGAGRGVGSGGIFDDVPVIAGAEDPGAATRDAVTHRASPFPYPNNAPASPPAVPPPAAPPRPSIGPPPGFADSAAAFGQGMAGEFLTAPFGMVRGAIGTVFGNPTQEELANPLVRASIVSRMGRMPDVQPRPEGAPGPALEAAEQLKGLVTMPIDAARDVAAHPEMGMRERGARAADVVMGGAGLFHGAKALRGELRGRAAARQTGEDLARIDPTGTGVFDDVRILPPEPPKAPPAGPGDAPRAEPTGGPPPAPPSEARQAEIERVAARIAELEPRAGKDLLGDTAHELAHWRRYLAELEAGRGQEARALDRQPPAPPEPTVTPPSISAEKQEPAPVPRDTPAEGSVNKEPERVRAAAVEVAGRVFEGPDHFAAIVKAQDAGVDVDNAEGSRHGFVTDRGRFIDDKEAKQLATEAGQLTQGPMREGMARGDRDYLDSGDLPLEGREEEGKYQPGPRPVPAKQKPARVNPLDVRNAGAQAFNDALADYHGAFGHLSGYGPLQVLKRLGAGESLDAALAAEHLPKPPGIEEKIRRLLQLEQGVNAADRAAGIEPWEPKPTGVPTAEGAREARKAPAIGEDFHGQRVHRQADPARVAAGVYRDAGDVDIRVPPIGARVLARHPDGDARPATVEWASGESLRVRFAGGVKRSGTFTDVLARDQQQAGRKPRPAPVEGTREHFDQQTAERSTADIGRGDRPVAESMKLLRELEAQADRSTSRPELEAIYAQMQDLYDRAGAGEIRSEIAKRRGQVTRKLNKLPPAEKAAPAAPASGPREYVSATAGGKPTPEQQHVVDVARRIKKNDPSAIAEAAREMAGRIPADAILIPVPGATPGNSGGSAAALAEAIAKLRGDRVEVWQAVKRAKGVRSSELARKKGERPPTYEQHRASLAPGPDQLTERVRDRPVVLIDNVEVTGNTARAVRDVLQLADDTPLVTYAKAEIPELERSAPAPKVTTKQERKASREAGRAARAASGSTEELLTRYAELTHRISQSKGGHGYARTNDYGETHVGAVGDARGADDQAAAEIILGELKKRGITDDDLVVAYHRYVDQLPPTPEALEEERQAEFRRQAEESHERAGVVDEQGSADFNPDLFTPGAERITAPAIQVGDDAPKVGRVGQTHHQVWKEHYPGAAAREQGWTEVKHLFQTSEGRIVDRFEGKKIARAAGQDHTLAGDYLTAEQLGREVSVTQFYRRPDRLDSPGESDELLRRGKFSHEEVSERPEAVQSEELGGIEPKHDRRQREMFGAEVNPGLQAELDRAARFYGANMGRETGGSLAATRRNVRQIVARFIERGIPRDAPQIRYLEQLAAETPARDADLFGNEAPDTSPAQGGLFGEKEGTAAARSTPEQLRALAGERDKLRVLIRGKLKDSASANARLAELDRILNRDEKIGAGEMETRARAEDLADEDLGPDQGRLLSPERERIRAAAVHDPKTGKVYEGLNHADAMDAAIEAGSDVDFTGDQEVDGFSTNLRDWVSRTEAAQIALDADQVKDRSGFEGDERNIALIAEDLKPGTLEAPGLARPARPRPYDLDELDGASDRQLRRWLDYEERLAMRELADQATGREPGAPKPGEPSKSIDELISLENELQAAERKLDETKSARIRELLEAQVHNRTRQQEAYVREYFTVGREKELPPELTKRFPNMKKDAPPPPPPGNDKRGDPYAEARRRREEFERRMRERARQERERRDQERARGRQERDQDKQREREDRDRDRHERDRARGRGAPPPPPPRGKPKPPPPPSMPANTVPVASGPGRVRSLFRIGRMFADALDATVRQGPARELNLHRARGFFRLVNEAIRVGRGEWLDVIAHEVGHFVSKTYLKHPTNRGAHGRGAIPLTRAMLHELRVMGKNLYGTRRPGLGYAEEGIAEWANFYVTDPARLAKEAPAFAGFMENTVFADHPRLATAFRAARDHYARFEHATPLDRVKAQLDVDPKGRGLPAWRDLVRTWFDDLHEFKLFDRAAKTSNYRESVYTWARLVRGAAGEADGWIKRGMVDVRDGRIVGSSVADVLAKIGTKDVDDFRAYLTAESALERWDAGINPGIRRGDAMDVAKQLAPKFKAQAEVIWKHYNLLLQALRDSGQLSNTAFNAIRARNQRHVGFYRVFDEFERPAGGKGGGRGYGQGAGVKAQKGSAREIIDPLESLMQDTYRTARKVAEARVAAVMVQVATTREAMGHLVDEVPQPKEPVEIYAPHVLEQLRALGLVKVDPLTGAIVKLEKDDLLGEVLLAFRDKQRPGAAELKDLVIPIRRGERIHWFQVMDRRLYDTLNGMTAPELAGWLRIGTGPVRTFRTGVTLTARFILKNVVRDANTAFIRTRGTGLILPFQHLVEGSLALWKEPALVDRWRAAGGDNATMLGLDRPTTARNYKRLLASTPAEHLVDLARHPIDTLRMLSSIGENLTRIGEYRIVERQRLKAGDGPVEAQTRAGYAARDVTQDFAMAGTAGRQVNQLVAFFNAQVNSVANLARDLRNRPLTVLPRIVAGVTLPSIALYWLQRDDPEYKRIPRWQRDIAWAYIQRGTDRSKGWDGYGSGKVEHRWFIPKAFEMGVLFGTVPERIAEWVHTHDNDAFDQVGKSLWQAVSPNFLPIVYDVPSQIAANRDRFRDRPIVGQRLAGKDAREQSTPWTGETARVIGGAMPGQGVSPAKIEFGVKGFTGGLGTVGLGAMDAGVRAFREAAGLPPLRKGSTVLQPIPGEDPFTQLPGTDAFTRRDPGDQAEDLAKLQRQYESAERRRQTWRLMLQDPDRRAEARQYLEAHRDEIISVATPEETHGKAGPLRQAYEKMTELRTLERVAPDRRPPAVGAMHRIAGAAERALR